MRPICFFNTSKAWGGGEHWVYENSTRAARSGWEVHVVTNTESALGDRLASENGLRLHRFPVSNLSFLNPLTMTKLVNFYKRYDIGSVIFSLPSDVKAGGIAARLARVGNIIYRRGIALPVRDSVFNRYLFRSVITRFICNSAETCRLALKENSELIENDRISVIHNGFNLDAFDEQSSIPIYQRQPGETILGNCGRLTRQKGQKLALDALKRLLDKGFPVRLLIAGSGELEMELKDYAQRIGVEDRVEFLGFVESLRGFYESIDILVHSALWEGFGYVLVEAMAARKPIVAFDISSNPEVVDDGVTGLLAAPENVDDFVSKIEMLIDSPALQVEYGDNGRDRVIAEFDSAQAFKRLASLVEN